jgi:ABC-type antimicrobial peptide transport system permease subunit
LPLAIMMSIVVAVGSAAYPAYRATTIKVSDSFRAL